MPIQLYRRHIKKCVEGKKGARSEWDKAFRRCKCPILAQGSLNRRPIRQSTGLTDWEEAEELVKQWKIAGAPSTTPLVAVAVAAYLKDCLSRNLAKSTKAKYRSLLGALQKFADNHGHTHLKHLNTEVLREFRDTWKDGPTSSNSKLIALKVFFGFAVSNDWLPINPAARIKGAKANQTPTLPFTKEEMIRILEACGTLSDRPIWCKRMWTICLLMRYSGLRIGDAYSLKVNDVVDGAILRWTQKTGTPVRVPLPPFVLEALDDTPKHGEYFFWNRRKKDSDLEGVVSRVTGVMKKVFVAAGIPSGRSHRFRDTFAVELLCAGVPIETVSALLGHSSIAITQKHYSPWVKARQTHAENLVKGTWEKPKDPPKDPEED